MVVPNDPNCPICGGLTYVRIVINEDEHVIHCYCQLKGWEDEQRARWGKLSTTTPGAIPPAYDTLIPTGTDNEWEEVQKTIVLAKEIAANPLDHKWLTLLGPVGTGKSTILQALWASCRSYCVYLGAGDLTSKVIGAISEKRVNEFISKLIEVPVLIIDDYGVEDVPNATIKNLITQIIDGRYGYRRHRPTVISTNKLIEPLRAQNQRVADRVLDQDLVDLIKLNLGTHRMRDYEIALKTKAKRVGRAS